MRNTTITFVALLLFFLTQSFSLKRAATTKATTKIVSGLFYNPEIKMRRPIHAYVLQEPSSSTEKPQKMCKGIGRDCSKNAISVLTDEEWQKFFPNVKDPMEFGKINVSEYPSFIDYLHSIGFGMGEE